ncbi:MAG: hypothetical protein DID89_2727546550 [Candidatus Nitrotoga sp. CP45]|nr:MAG: hypothetical protein DID89_2727546550 [Candidatus Nitrotoga sp. CP45]
MQVNKYKFYEQFKLGDSRINRAESIVYKAMWLGIDYKDPGANYYGQLLDAAKSDYQAWSLGKMCRHASLKICVF